MISEPVTNQLLPSMSNASRHIEHVIVLMLENRSFDHMFGDLDQGKFKANKRDFHATSNRDNDGRTVPPYANNTFELHGDLDHSHLGILEQLFGERRYYPDRRKAQADCSGFLKNHQHHLQSAEHTKVCSSQNCQLYAREVLKYKQRSQLPVLASLAENFTTCSRWFSSVPGETWPNRNFLHAATSDGEVNIARRFYFNRTVFEDLESNDLEWRIYHEGPAQAWAFPGLISERKSRFMLNMNMGMNWLLGCAWPTSSVITSKNFRQLRALTNDIEKDQLPAYAFVEPHHG